jgi:hypothetical protein
MRRRAFLSVLGAAVLAFAPISGVARVGVMVNIAPPAPAVETVPPHRHRNMFGRPAIGLGTASTMFGCLEDMSGHRIVMRCGYRTDGSDAIVVGCGLRGIGGE